MSDEDAHRQTPREEDISSSRGFAHIQQTIQPRCLGEAVVEITTVCAMVFTLEENKRYAGSFDAQARMTINYAGTFNL